MTDEMMNRNADLFNPMNFLNDMGNLGRDWFNGSDNPMKTDVVEHDHDYVVTANMPGLNKDDIHVDYRDDTLRITGKSRVSHDTKDENGRILRQERSTSNVARAFYLPDVDLKQVQAKYADGVLTLTLPKASDQDRNHQIDIQ